MAESSGEAPNTAAVMSDLKKMPLELQSSALAQIALSLAVILDGQPGARDAAAVAKELRTTMAELREIAGRKLDDEDPLVRLEKEFNERA
jgi:hypothetical protein